MLYLVAVSPEGCRGVISSSLGPLLQTAFQILFLSSADCLAAIGLNSKLHIIYDVTRLLFQRAIAGRLLVEGLKDQCRDDVSLCALPTKSNSW